MKRKNNGIIHSIREKASIYHNEKRRFFMKITKHDFSLEINRSKNEKVVKIRLKMPKNSAFYDIISACERGLAMDVKVKGEYITLGQLLKVTDMISSGGEAKYALKQLSISVNGLSENRRGRKLYPGDIVIVADNEFHLI